MILIDSKILLTGLSNVAPNIPEIVSTDPRPTINLPPDILSNVHKSLAKSAGYLNKGLITQVPILSFLVLLAAAAKLVRGSILESHVQKESKPNF